MLCEKKHLRNNNKSHEIKIIQVICCTYCKLWLIIMETFKKDLKIIESVQKKATAWILSPTQKFKDRLICVHILPLSLYHELHIPLLLHKILTGKTDLLWKKFIRGKEKGQTRYASIKKYESKQFRLQKSEIDFFVRPCNITNALNEHLKFDIMEHENIKELITNVVFWRYFKEKFNKNDPCSWRIDCRCMNCKTSLETELLKL